jgi:hypothetical protein
MLTFGDETWDFGVFCFILRKAGMRNADEYISLK